MAHPTENIIIITSYVDAPFDMKQALTQMEDPYIICTDGGFDLAKQAGITPHLLLGDLDSIQSRIPKELPLKTFPPEKDYTDLELAIHTAIEKKASHVEIWGGIGGRLDHTVCQSAAALLLCRTVPLSFDVMTVRTVVSFSMQRALRKASRSPRKKTAICHFFLFLKPSRGSLQKALNTHFKTIHSHARSLWG